MNQNDLFKDGKGEVIEVSQETIDNINSEREEKRLKESIELKSAIRRERLGKSLIVIGLLVSLIIIGVCSSITGHQPFPIFFFWRF